MGFLSWKREPEIPAPIVGTRPFAISYWAEFCQMRRQWTVRASLHSLALVIDRIDFDQRLHYEDLKLLVEYLGCPALASTALKDIPTISYDIAIQTIEFIKEAK
ncbi:hypothetical protein [Pseudomonas sp. B14(2017)]|uniref:hypothetical protein n=1 Tax=Pseudomonas sp. B14(2017) TaxID=1981745 RepID=UPI000A1F462C|nr:hypothetical protein [Pseudomonas sp. B14(2017)]